MKLYLLLYICIILAVIHQFAGQPCMMGIILAFMFTIILYLMSIQ